MDSAEEYMSYMEQYELYTEDNAVNRENIGKLMAVTDLFMCRNDVPEIQLYHEDMTEIEGAGIGS